MLNKALLLLTLLCLPSYAQALNVSTLWEKCSADSQCVKVAGPCGEDRAVSKDFAEGLKQRWLEEGRLISCELIPHTVPVQPACVNRICRMVEKTD